MIVDDQALVRTSLTMILQPAAGSAIVVAARDRRDAVVRHRTSCSWA
ncbi:hypothetical protein [Nonomuraea aurantiaca]|nr:hypothetical protein [Nonomuraea aurantiaca]MCA2225972.1 hypothetical protein [Nonomuraea aurantiaca]